MILISDAFARNAPLRAPVPSTEAFKFEPIVIDYRDTKGFDDTSLSSQGHAFS